MTMYRGVGRVKGTHRRQLGIWGLQQHIVSTLGLKRQRKGTALWKLVRAGAVDAQPPGGSQAHPQPDRKAARGVSVPASLSTHPLGSAAASHWPNPTESQRAREPEMQPRGTQGTDPGKAGRTVGLGAMENGQRGVQTAVGWGRDGVIKGPWEVFKVAKLIKIL